MVARLQNRYDLGEPIERLDDGAWYRGMDARARRAVHVALLDAPAAAERVEVFERVARLCARIHHPSIERIVTSGQDPEGRHFLIVEWQGEETLEAELGRTPARRLHDLLRSITSVLNGLEIAHKSGLVHGGIEPSRIRVDKKLCAQLIAFGLHGSSAAGAPYRAPEIAAGDAPTAASDVYSMAAIVHRAFVGEPPRTNAEGSLLERRKGLPIALAEVVERALSKAPVDRPSSAGELRKELTTAMIRSPGLRTLLVWPSVELGTAGPADVVEPLTLADLEEPTAYEKKAWTRPSNMPAPPKAALAAKGPARVRAEAPRANDRNASPTAIAAEARARAPEALFSPSNASTNTRSTTSTPRWAGGAPPKPVARPVAPPKPAAHPLAPPKPAVAATPVRPPAIPEAPVATPATPRPAVAIAPAVVVGTPAVETVEPAPPETPAWLPASPAALPNDGLPSEASLDEDPERMLEDATEDPPLPWAEMPALDHVDRGHAGEAFPSPAIGPWPYPTGGPPGLVRSAEPERRTRVLPPKLAIGLLSLGVVIAAIGLVRLAIDRFTAEDVAADGATIATAPPPLEPQHRVRPRRVKRALRPHELPVAPPPAPSAEPAPIVAPAPQPTVQMGADEEVTAEGPAEPEIAEADPPEARPARPRHRRRRRRGTTRPSAPSTERQSPRVVRDPGF